MNFQLRALRKSHGFTQDDVAQAIGETKRVVGAWERQDTPIPFEKACDIADFLGCSLDELAGRDWPPNNFAPVTNDERMLIDDFRRMEDGNKKSLIDTAHTFAIATELKKGSNGRNVGVVSEPVGAVEE